MWVAASSCQRVTSSSPAGAGVDGANRSASHRLPHSSPKNTTLKVAARPASTLIVFVQTELNPSDWNHR